MKKVLVSMLMVFTIIFSSFGFTACNSTAKPKALALDNTSIEMQQYEQVTLVANKEGVEWESSDPRTVKVENGVVTSLKLGSATVSAKLGEEVATCEVTVTPQTKGRALTVSETNLKLKQGEDATVTAELKEDGTKLDVIIEWNSEDNDVATVENGKITAVGKGNTVVTASTTYFGQNFEKQIEVVVAEYADIDLCIIETKTALSVYQGQEDLGFATESQVYEWNVGAGKLWDDRIWADGVIPAENPEYQLLIMNVKFTSNKIDDIIIWLKGDTVKFGHDFIGEGLTHATSTNQSKVCLYGADGKVATGYINPDIVYTMVIDIDGITNNGEAFGIGVNAETKVYVANAIACSKNYATATFTDLDLPKYPIYDDLYIALDVSNNITKIDPLTEGEWANWCQIDYSTDAWGRRLHVGRTDINTVFVVNQRYSEYSYFGFNVVLTSAEFSEIIIWNGSLNAIFLRPNGTFSAQNSYEVQEDDVRYYVDGIDVTGQPLQANVVYTFRIQIKKTHDPYGFGLNKSSVDGILYASKPYFMK